MMSEPQIREWIAELESGFDIAAADQAMSMKAFERLATIARIKIAVLKRVLGES